MTKKHFSKVLALLAAVCITAGCDGGAATETTTSAGTAVTEQTSTSNQQEISPEISKLEALEVDYVDEYGRIYYKNPTIWTQEKVFQEFTINGQKFEAPLTIEKLGDSFSIAEETMDYLESDKIISAELTYQGSTFGTVSIKDDKTVEDINDEEIILMTVSDVLYKVDVLPDILLSGVGISSSRSDVISALGVPCREDISKGPIVNTLIYNFENCMMIFRLDSDSVRTMYIGFVI